MVRIGFFAGTFDPIHDGHLAVAKQAQRFLELENLYFLVEKSPWGEKQPISNIHRTRMVELATKDRRNLSVLEVTDDRFTIESTLPWLEKEFSNSEFYFIFGADIFLNMNDRSWPGLSKLLRHYIVVFERANVTEKEITDHAIELGIVVAIIPSTHPHHRSTDVRLHPHKKYIWVPKVVAAYMMQEKLYEQTEGSEQIDAVDKQKDSRSL